MDQRERSERVTQMDQQASSELAQQASVCLMCGGPAGGIAVCPNGERRPCCTECAISSKPRIVVLCGSTKFKQEFELAELEWTLRGYVVLTVGGFGHADMLSLTQVQKRSLDRLHKYKISMADEVLVLNKDGYIGSSTRSEIEYAELSGKPVRYKWTTTE